MANAAGGAGGMRKETAGIKEYVQSLEVYKTKLSEKILAMEKQLASFTQDKTFYSQDRANQLNESISKLKSIGSRIDDLMAKYGLKVKTNLGESMAQEKAGASKIAAKLENAAKLKSDADTKVGGGSQSGGGSTTPGGGDQAGKSEGVKTAEDNTTQDDTQNTDKEDWNKYFDDYKDKMDADQKKMQDEFNKKLERMRQDWQQKNQNIPDIQSPQGMGTNVRTPASPQMPSWQTPKPFNPTSSGPSSTTGKKIDVKSGVSSIPKGVRSSSGTTSSNSPFRNNQPGAGLNKPMGDLDKLSLNPLDNKPTGIGEKGFDAQEKTTKDFLHEPNLEGMKTIGGDENLLRSPDMSIDEPLTAGPSGIGKGASIAGLAAGAGLFGVGAVMRKNENDQADEEFAQESFKEQKEDFSEYKNLF